MTKADSVHSTPQTSAPAERPLEKLARLHDEATRAAGALPALSASVIPASGSPAVLPRAVESEPVGSVESYSGKGASKISRRSIMNMLVSSAAVAAAMPVAAEAAKIPSGLEHRAIFARAQQAVNWLRESFVCDGWKIDEARATASLAYLGRQAAGGPAEEEAEQAAIAFFGDHGQSLDWIFLGDPSGMVCGALSA